MQESKNYGPTVLSLPSKLGPLPFTWPRAATVFGLFILVVSLFTSCGPRKPSGGNGPVQRAFPRVEVPGIYVEEGAQMEWLANHYWDKFLAPAAAVADTLNGVTRDALDQEMGMFVSIVGTLPLSAGQKAVGRFGEQLETFLKEVPEAGPATFRNLSELLSHYLYDPNSPVRCEDLYLPFVSRFAASDALDAARRSRFEWEARMCSLNRIGEVATDFSFIDLAGKTRTMHSIKAEYLVLIFGNPDCTACRDLTDQMTADPDIAALVSSKRVIVADIFIDPEIDIWKSKADTYPKSWINGYDPSMVIRSDMIYDVRAIPSIYLLDSSKRVLIKDATTDALLAYLSRL